MFEATYLGWQSWLFASARARILIDPVLVDEVGHGPRDKRLSFHFWPPRCFSWEHFPQVDVVFITHEHEDHFSPASLARLDRSIPIWLSARASQAARMLLSEMGFRVDLVAPDALVRHADLELHAYGPDHTASLVTDEWDTLSYLVRDEGGHGSFFTNVDVPVTDAARDAVRQMARTRGAKEMLLFEGMSIGLSTDGSLGTALMRSEMHAAPSAMAYADAMSAAPLRRGERLRPLAGQTFLFESGALTEIRANAPFLRVPPLETWPPRPRFWRDRSAPLEPFCGMTRFDDADWPDVQDGLARLAEHLYGHYLFRRLYSLDERALHGRMPTLLWVLQLDGEGGAAAFEYRPQECAFQSVDPAPDFERRYAGLASCWATDLLALMRGDFEPRAITKSFHEAWHPACGGVSLLTDVLWEYFHPLRHPAAALRRYRAAIAEEGEAPCLVRASRSGDVS